MDKKYRAKINLIGYGIFVVIVIIYAVLGNRDNIQSMMNEYKDINPLQEDTNVSDNNSLNIILFDKYAYDIVVKINDIDYNYSGEYKNNVLTINKDNVEEYIYKDNNYYIKDSNELIEKNKIYDVVVDEFIDINIINEYLRKATYDGNNYCVYLKDIILGNNGNKYIVINYSNNLNEIKIEIDYTNLFSYFNKDIEKYMVLMKYNKIID